MTALPCAPTLPRFAAANAFALAILTAVAFGGTLAVCFTQDDFWLLEAAQRPWPDGAMLGGALAPDYVRPLPTYWLPLLAITLFGVDPWWHHLVLLLLLVGTVIALHRAVLWWTGSLAGAATTAAVYAFSEVHLYTLGWLAGANDVLSACGLAAALWLIARRGAGGGRVWPALTAYALALLSKEHSVVLAAAWIGKSLVDRAVNGPAAPAQRRFERRLAVGFVAITAAFGILWLWLTHGSRLDRHLAFAPSRALQVLRDSIAVVHPTLDGLDRVASGWLAVPVGALVSTLVWRGRAAAGDVAFAALLWLLPATIFGLTTFPADLQPYYANFSVFGLALCVGQAVAALAARTAGRMRLAAAAACVVLLGAYGVVSIVHRRSDVAAHRSPALQMSTLTAAAEPQIRAALAAHPARRIVFLGVHDDMWWALGKGAMIPVLYGDCTAQFDGQLGFAAPPDVRTGGDTLVLRQVDERRFEVVQ